MDDVRLVPNGPPFQPHSAFGAALRAHSRAGGLLKRWFARRVGLHLGCPCVYPLGDRPCTDGALWSYPGCQPTRCPTAHARRSGACVPDSALSLLPW